ncbi:hypothetical protein RP20_CCG025547 [Aedes albopictus]|nr:hypothetical protein RP20_CCG025547 [Aedes albopictus]
MMIDAILNGLLDRGHQVTCIANYPLSRKHENYTELRVAPIYDFWKNSVKVESLYDLTEISIHRMLMDFLYSLGLETAQHGFTRENVRDFIRNDDSHFDLILAEQFYQEAYLMFAHKYKAPIVSVGLPSNVMIKPWLPQSDILAHPNVKVFITHGGLLGTQEGVYRAVPMLGIPIYCDQHLNMNKAVLGGYAVRLYFPNITETSFRWALEELLYKPEYKRNMDRVSGVFRDRPVPALDEAVYWVEYVIRHKGAPQLRSAGLDLPWVSFALLDVLALAVGIVLVVVWVLRKLVMLFQNDSKPKRKAE